MKTWIAKQDGSKNLSITNYTGFTPTTAKWIKFSTASSYSHFSNKHDAVTKVSTHQLYVTNSFSTFSLKLYWKSRLMPVYFPYNSTIVSRQTHRTKKKRATTSQLSTVMLSWQPGFWFVIRLHQYVYTQDYNCPALKISDTLVNRHSPNRLCV